MCCPNRVRTGKREKQTMQANINSALVGYPMLQGTAHKSKCQQVKMSKSQNSDPRTNVTVHEWKSPWQCEDIDKATSGASGVNPPLACL